MARTLLHQYQLEEEPSPLSGLGGRQVIQQLLDSTIHLIW